MSEPETNGRFWKIAGLAVTLGIVTAGGLVTYGILSSDVQHVQAAVREKVSADVYHQHVLTAQAAMADTRDDIKENQKSINENHIKTTEQLGAIGGDIKGLKGMMRQMLRRNGGP